MSASEQIPEEIQEKNTKNTFANNGRKKKMKESH